MNNIQVAHSPHVDGTPAALYAPGPSETALDPLQVDATGAAQDSGDPVATPDITNGFFDPGDL
jgi:hypothetical protein